MATRLEDGVRLLGGHSEQNPPNVVNAQPRARSSSSTSSGISTLSIVIKALRGEREYDKCWCFFYPQQSHPLVASALLIGNSKQQGQVTRDSSGSRLYHVERLRSHLSQLNVRIFECYANYQVSQDDLHETISKFLSQEHVYLFILYYTGPTDDRGNWEFTTTEYDSEYKDHVRLDSIAKRWKRKTNASCQLLIIVDAEHSGKWVKQVKQFETKSNISIMAPSANIGGQYTQSLIGSQGVEFYPDNVQRKIDRFLSDDTSLPPVFAATLVHVDKSHQRFDFSIPYMYDIILSVLI